MATLEKILTKEILEQAVSEKYFLSSNGLPVVARGIENNSCFFCIGNDDETSQIPHHEW